MGDRAVARTASYHELDDALSFRLLNFNDTFNREAQAIEPDFFDAIANYSRAWLFYKLPRQTHANTV